MMAVVQIIQGNMKEIVVIDDHLSSSSSQTASNISQRSARLICLSNGGYGLFVEQRMF